MSDAVSLAHSPCPNDTFVFHAWNHGLIPGAPRTEVTIADIDVTNELARRGELDVLKVSYAALPAFLDRYALLPTGGALGHGCGPLVVVRADGDGPAPTPSLLDGAVVAVPSERSTAYLLLRVWAAERLTAGPREIRVLPFQEIMPAVRDGAVDAGLIIHEARFTYPRYGLRALVDLGEAWELRTGLPIPLGAIVARRSLGAGRLRELADVLRASVTRAWADPAASARYVREHAQEMRDEVVKQHIALYVNEYTADLGPAGYRAVLALLDAAAELGLGPRTDPALLAFPPEGD